MALIETEQAGICSYDLFLPDDWIATLQILNSLLCIIPDTEQTNFSPCFLKMKTFLLALIDTDFQFLKPGLWIWGPCITLQMKPFWKRNQLAYFCLPSSLFLEKEERRLGPRCQITGYADGCGSTYFGQVQFVWSLGSDLSEEPDPKLSIFKKKFHEIMASAWVGSIQFEVGSASLDAAPHAVSFWGWLACIYLHK